MVSFPFLSRFFLELGVIQRLIGAIVDGQQFLMRAFLNNPAIVNDDDFVSVLNGRQAMGDNKDGTVLHQVVNGFHEELKRMLETKLITKILEFKPNKVA